MAIRAAALRRMGMRGVRCSIRMKMMIPSLT